MVKAEDISIRATALYDILADLHNSPKKTMVYADFRKRLNLEPNGQAIWGELLRTHIVRAPGKKDKRTHVNLIAPVEGFNIEVCRDIIRKIVNKHRDLKGRPHVPAEVVVQQEKLELFYSKEDLINGITELKAKYDKFNPDSPVNITVKSEESTTIR
jgi:hypothetical protein